VPRFTMTSVTVSAAQSAEIVRLPRSYLVLVWLSGALVSQLGDAVDQRAQGLENTVISQ
jgi:hypothetical protein